MEAARVEEQDVPMESANKIPPEELDTESKLARMRIEDWIDANDTHLVL